MHKLWLVGGGSGQPDYLLPLAKQVLGQADCVIASERFLKLAAGKKQIPMKQLSALLEQLPTLLQTDSVAILVSGDPLLYSFYFFCGFAFLKHCLWNFRSAFNILNTFVAGKMVRKRS